MKHLLKQQHLPEPHKADIRSLSLFRILISVFLLFDIVCRLQHGKLSLSWYTASPSPSYPPIIHPEDTPHGSPVHKYLWFYRSSQTYEIIMWTCSVISVICMGLGWRSEVCMTTTWLLMTSNQHRGHFLNDGSDSFVRCLLLWMCLGGRGVWSRVWSLDSYFGRWDEDDDVDDVVVNGDDEMDVGDNNTRNESMRVTTKSGSTLKHRKISPEKKEEETISRRNGSNKEDDDDKKKKKKNRNTIQSISILGITTQISLMYLGTALHRVQKGSDGTWSYPKYTAVYYVLRQTFATRIWSSRLVGQYRQLSRLLTASAMTLELGCPSMLLLLNAGEKWARTIPAGLLFMLHLGLYASMRLPNWQILGMITQMLWIPTATWDYFIKQQDNSKDDGHKVATPTVKSGVVRKYLNRFFYLYMIYNWCGERGWIPKHDNGDIGEFFRCSQYWVMYGPDVGTHSISVLITGTLSYSEDNKQNKYLDIMKAIRNNKYDHASSEMDHDTYQYMLNEDQPPDMASRYPTWRWETAINSWVKRNVRPYRFTTEMRLRRLARVLCRFVNDKRKDGQVLDVEIAIMGLNTLDFHDVSGKRFQRSRQDVNVKVSCRLND